ncbi:MAG TPA: c-type cytochrome [Blastocatellia bacterium]|nr:c-type cytochrome [Blastocatellia bacterium]
MRRRKTVLVILTLVLISSISFAGASHWSDYNVIQNQEGRLTPEEARKLKSPVPFSKESITRGRAVFARNCTACHGNDGKSEVDVVANATDLTEPKLWRSGTLEGEIFRSIRDGAGDTMPPFKSQLQKEEDLWHLVNFIRSLWPEPMRPKLQ